jgi:hypothetical protein
MVNCQSGADIWRLKEFRPESPLSFSKFQISIQICNQFFNSEVIPALPSSLWVFKKVVIYTIQKFDFPKSKWVKSRDN